MSHRAHRSRVLVSPLFQLEDRTNPSPGGDLDPTFGTGGTAVVSIPSSISSSALAVSVQADGNVLLGGNSYLTIYIPVRGGGWTTIPYFTTARLHADGTLDQTYNGGVQFQLGSLSAPFSVVAFQPDGKILAVNNSYHTTRVTRWLPDGPRDTSFQGYEIPSVSTNAVAIQSDGKIVVAGWKLTRVNAGGEDEGVLAVARLNPDGTLDTGFGSGGLTTFPSDPANPGRDEAHGVAIQPDGKIVLAGFVHTAGGGRDMVAARLLPDGQIDPSFGSAGLVAVPFGPVGYGTSTASAVSVQPDGRILLAGEAVPVGGTDQGDFAAARLNPDGTLDTGFGPGGRVIVPFDLGGTNADTANAVAVLRDGNIILTGSAEALSGHPDKAAVRLLSDGRLDPAFGSGGKTTVRFDLGGTNADEARAMTIQPDGKIILAGYADSANGPTFAAVRLLGDPPTIGDIPDGTVPANATLGPLPFAVGYGAGDPALLTVTASSNNPFLIPDAAIALGGTGANRTLTITPLTGQSGTATVTVTVRDAAGQAATETFQVTVLPPPPPPPPPVPVPQPALAGGLPGGTARALDPSGGPYTLRATLSFFPDFAGVVRTATADVTGDGVPDWVGGAGPGGGPRVVVLDGATGGRVADFFAFEPTFSGGVFVAAADLDGDGRAEVVVTSDGGGPVVAVFDGTGTERARFFGIEDPSFHGGSRAALGDINGDGTPDLIVSAGIGGGPRVAVFDGTSVLGGGSPVKLMGDFFAFEDTLRNGAFVAAGDVDGDGVADVAFGGGPGGAPRVRLIDGKALLAAGPFSNLDAVPTAQRADFFAGDSSLRGGVRLVLKDTDGDGKADLVTGSGEGEPSRVQVFKSGNLLANPNPTADQELDPFGAVLADGVFVG